MAERETKTTFTENEQVRIITLVRELEKAEPSKQKGIRAKIRKIGLYWSEVASGAAYTVANLLTLFDDGTLKVSDGMSGGMETLELSNDSPSVDVKLHSHIDISADEEIQQFRKDGFDGFIPVSLLRGNSSVIPEEGGVYVVLRECESAPQFLEKGTGGFFKGKDPNVSVTELADNYVSDSITVYIGKATNLRSRIGQLLRFGAGASVGHWGGRYLWQLKDSDNLIVAWKVTAGIDPRKIEAEMIRNFVSFHGKRPFANLKD